MAERRTGTRRLDVTRAGDREYDEHQAASVRLALEDRVGPARAVKVADLAERTGVDGRTVRAIVTDLDGVVFLIGGGDDGLFVCAFAEEGEPLTRRLSATEKALADRVHRRRLYATHQLPRRQETLM